MRKDEWAKTLRAIAAKASPVTAEIFRAIAARNEAEFETEGQWIAALDREPGEEG